MSRARRHAGNATTPSVIAIGLLAGALAGYWNAAPLPERETPAGIADQMASALREIDPIAKRRALARVTDATTASNAAEVFSGFERDSVYPTKCEAQRFFATWAGLDLPAASEAAVAIESPLLRRHATSTVLYELGLAGRIEEGRTLLDQLSIPRVRDPAYAAFVEGVVRSGDIEAANAFLQGPNNSRRNRVLESFIRSYLIADDVEGLIAWVDAIPDDAPQGLKRSAFALAARWLSSIDPLRAAAWYDAQPEGAAHTRLAHVAIGEEWIERDPNAALEWAIPHIPPEDEAVDMRRLITRFFRSDPAAALAWMERREPLGIAEAAIPAVVNSLEMTRPDEALAWAQRIEDQPSRDASIERLLRGWLERDPDAARAWIEKNALPEGVRKALATQAEPPHTQPNAEGGTSS